MANVQDVVNWVANRRGRFAYSQLGDRLHPDQSGSTDCSALIIAAYREVLGMNIGTYTGNMLTHGTVVFDESMESVGQAQSLLIPGDCVFFNWYGHNPTYDHVELYAGSGNLWSHGGPGYGPILTNFTREWNSASEIRAVRMVAGAGTGNAAPSVPATGASTFPAWPFPQNEYIGDINGPNESHGGANAYERPYIKLAQQRLYDRGFAPFGLNREQFADGIFESPWSTESVRMFQEKYMPGTEFYGQLWSDDWAKLGSI